MPITALCLLPFAVLAGAFGHSVMAFVLMCISLGISAFVGHRRVSPVPTWRTEIHHQIDIRQTIAIELPFKPAQDGLRPEPVQEPKEPVWH